MLHYKKQVVARYVDPNPNPTQEKMVGLPSAIDRDAVTIGEALEASALSAGNKPITRTDAAAIQAAEMLATKTNKTPPGGLGAEAQSAALRNEQITSQVNKTTLGDILMVSQLLRCLLWGVCRFAVGFFNCWFFYLIYLTS